MLFLNWVLVNVVIGIFAFFFLDIGVDIVFVVFKKVKHVLKHCVEGAKLLQQVF